MKKDKIIPLLIVIITIIAFFTVFLLLDKDNYNNNNINIYNENIEEKKPQELTEEEKIDIKIEETISKMTLREKIGQMLIISYEGEYTDELENILNEVKPSGFIVFPKNITTYKETVKYISNVRKTESIPMFISIDQEGGRVQRIKNIPDINVQTIPSMLELGKTNNSELSYKVGSVLAKEIAAFGINLDFAPVIDIFSNPNNTVIGDRAFGTDSQTVINMAIPFAKGMESESIIPVYKHFPGHGDTNTDSHIELPIVTKTKEELYENELLPFKAAIQNNAKMIMVGHIALPNITGDYAPASLSKVMIDDILRKEMGFDGVVITDAINMGALQDNYTLEEICNYSINAGVDIILMPLEPIQTANTIEKLVNNGTISEEKINDSVERILRLKYSTKLDEKKYLKKDNIGTQENINIINKISE